MLRLKSFPYILIIFSAFLFLGACNLINPDENRPSFIEVNKFTFDPLPTALDLGLSNSTNIKDVWVYVDNQFLGAYELPARFPVLKTGFHKINLSPGIFLNGIAATRSPYPFYTTQIFETELPENGTVTLNPVTSYFSGVKASYFEDFEGSGFSLVPTAQSDTNMVLLPTTDPNVFEGAGSGAAYLDSSGTLFEVTSTSYYSLPGSGAGVFLELDYKINQSLQMGLFVNIPGQGVEQVPIYTLNPTTTWNKIYIQLGYTVSAYGGSSSGFKVYFGAVKDPGVVKSEFYLDNIKVVHF